MKSSIQKELTAISIVLIPLIYILLIWDQLPDKVAMHWNIEGNIDRYGSKFELLVVAGLLPLVTYVTLLIVPKIDPKKKIASMGKKYHQIKVFLVSFMSILSIFIVYSAKQENIFNPNYLILIIGLFYIVLGNYFKTIKANYFIGIRTPWTLENEKIWKETHRLGGVLWFSGGSLVVLLSLLLPKELAFKVFIGVTVFISIIPVLYSYWLYRKISKTG